jgi:hypothetical protein
VMGPGNLPAVRVVISNIVLFSPKSIQIPVPVPVGRPDMRLSPSTCEFCWVRLESSIAMSGSMFQVILCMIAFKDPTDNREILTFVSHCLF